MIRIGLLGAGHLGKIHLRLLLELPDFDVVGFYDSDAAVRAAVAAAHGVRAYDSMEALVADVEAVDIVTPTLAHHACAEHALAAGRHMFIEKPLTETPQEAAALLELLATRPGLVAQVGHVERFNPALLALEGRQLAPMFIEGHRLAMYNPRGTDVSVVLDLMIHDLDVILSLVRVPVRRILASGVSVVSESPDIANARIEFENGCVANLTASRISTKNMRRLRFFQKNAYVAVDFLQKQAEIFHLSDTDAGHAEPGKVKFPLGTGTGTKTLILEQPRVPEVNAIQMELRSFAAAIRGEAPVPVSLADGYRALDLAYRIIGQIEASQEAALVSD
ncbi:MAG: Gfo/Idh/MocA family oxidoreductase [Bacteroidia bacterium]